MAGAGGVHLTTSIYMRHINAHEPHVRAASGRAVQGTGAGYPGGSSATSQRYSRTGANVSPFDQALETNGISASERIANNSASDLQGRSAHGLLRWGTRRGQV